MVRPVWLFAIVGMVLGPAGAIACRYSVRDVAFVDLGTGGYSLAILTDTQTPPELVERLHGAAAGVLVDTNVRLQMARDDDAMDPQLKALIAAHDIAARPAAVLVAPDGRALPIALPSDPSQENLWATFDQVVSSPVRDKVFDAALKAHSVVLVVEGRDRQANLRAREIADGAIDQARRGLADLPKPIEQPPQLLLVTPAEAKREAVFLWSLQVDSTDDSTTQVVVLYGRGRRLGPVLVVPGATQAELSRLLWYVGQDCECDLDRSWMQATMVPHRWDTQWQARAVKRLGFDAGSPMVIAEISRILARGPSSSAPADNALGLDDPLMGYREFTIADPAAADSNVAPEAGPSSSPMATPQAEPIAVADAAAAHADIPGRDAPPAKIESRESPDPEPASPVGIGPMVGFVLIGLVIVAAVGGGLVWVRSVREV